MTTKKLTINIEEELRQKFKEFVLKQRITMRTFIVNEIIKAVEEDQRNIDKNPVQIRSTQGNKHT